MNGADAMGAVWITSSCSESNGQCAEAARVTDAVATRDSTFGQERPALAVPPAQQLAFHRTP
ncbi:DUF397 domain-containing protein [Streptomyces sp. PT12]|nr:DUF397 domain-containing protein [Streptomyces sp. PT12]